MQPCYHLFYATHDGHTRKIASFMEKKLRAQGIVPQVTDLVTQDAPSFAGMAEEDKIIVLAAIRYGYPNAAAEAFLKNHAEELKSKKLAMLLVNLTARKPDKTTLKGSVYLRSWIKRHKLSPDIIEAIAGMLNYPIYKPFDRFMIRFIMKITGGPTDPKTIHEFTNWDQVEDITKRIVAL